MALVWASFNEENPGLPLGTDPFLYSCDIGDNQVKAGSLGIMEFIQTAMENISSEEVVKQGLCALKNICVNGTCLGLISCGTRGCMEIRFLVWAASQWHKLQDSMFVLQAAIRLGPALLASWRSSRRQWSDMCSAKWSRKFQSKAWALYRISAEIVPALSFISCDAHCLFRNSCLCLSVKRCACV